jgi:hypothetical protein
MGAARDGCRSSLFSGGVAAARMFGGPEPEIQTNISKEAFEKIETCQRSQV